MPPYLGVNTAHCKAEHRTHTKDEASRLLRQFLPMVTVAQAPKHIHQMEAPP